METKTNLYYKGIICCEDIRVLLEIHRIVHFAKLKAVDTDTYYVEVRTSTEGLGGAKSPFATLFRLRGGGIKLPYIDHADFFIEGITLLNDLRTKEIYITNDSGEVWDTHIHSSWNLRRYDECDNVQEFKFYMELGELL